jgi:hypothetical protein
MPTTRKPLEHSTERVREGKRGIPFLLFFTLLTSLSLPVQSLFAQSNQQQLIGQQFRMGEALIRIAEPGQLADTVNVWGDVGVTGRYLVPRGTSLTDMISYARGPIRFTTGETIFDRSDFRIDVIISRADSAGREQAFEYSYAYRKPLPEELRFFPLKDGDLIYIQSRRKPTFRDYITVLSPTISLALSAILLYDRAVNR